MAQGTGCATKMLNGTGTKAAQATKRRRMYENIDYIIYIFLLTAQRLTVFDWFYSDDRVLSSQPHIVILRVSKSHRAVNNEYT